MNNTTVGSEDIMQVLLLIEVYVASFAIGCKGILLSVVAVEPDFDFYTHYGQGCTVSSIVFICHHCQG